MPNNKTEQMKLAVLAVLAENKDGIHAVDLFRQAAAKTGDEIDPFSVCAKLGYDPDDLIALAA